MVIAEAPAQDQPAAADPQPPPSVSAAVDLKFWGRVNFVAAYDNFQGAGGIGGIDYQNYLTRQGDEQLNFNARDTRLGFAAASTRQEWTGRAVFEMDFYGANSGASLLPRLRLGYVDVAHAAGFSLRCGQDWLPIATQNPCTLDFGILAWSGNLWNRVPQITARYKLDDFDFTLGALHARVAGAQDQQERMPWVVARVGWSGLAAGSVLAIGGGVRSNTITPTSGIAAGMPRDTVSHVLTAEAKLPLADFVTVTAEAWAGDGIGCDFVRAGLDYGTDGEPMAGAGGFVNTSWRLDSRWSVNVGVGVDQPSDRDTTATTAFGTTVPYDSNCTVFANLRFQVDEQLGMGVEVMDMHTELANGVGSGDDGSRLRGQRVTLGMWYTF